MLSIHILTKNSEKTLFSTLESLKSFPEVIVLDTGSTDKTLEIASQFKNVIIHKAPMSGFGEVHNKAAELSSHDWILAIDSDEILSPGLVHEIETIQKNPYFIYAIRRDNFFNGKRMRCCAGWHPDWVLRLYNRKTTAFSTDRVHEKVKTENLKIARLKHPMTHVPYRSIADFLEKMQTYSTFFAEQHQGKKHSSTTKAILHALSAFLKNYFLCRGIFGGKEGLIISLYNAQTTYYKYLKLAELNRNL